MRCPVCPSKRASLLLDDAYTTSSAIYLSWHISCPLNHVRHFGRQVTFVPYKGKNNEQR